MTKDKTTRTVEEITSDKAIHHYLLDQGFEGGEAFTTEEVEETLIYALEHFTPLIVEAAKREGREEGYSEGWQSRNEEIEDLRQQTSEAYDSGFEDGGREAYEEGLRDADNSQPNY